MIDSKTLIRVMGLLVQTVRALFRSRADRALENLALRQQLAVKTTYRSPWQNGVAERWILSCRSEMLDHVIVLNEQHLRRLLGEYVNY